MKEFILNFDRNILVNTQVTISTICVTWFGWIISKLSDRYANVSTKKLFFSNTIYRVNGYWLIFLSVVLDIVSIVAAGYKLDDEIFFVSLVVIICFVLEMALILVLMIRVYFFYSKKSKIYVKIWKKLIKDKRKKVYSLFRDKMSGYSLEEQEEEKLHNSYFVEEMITFYILYHESIDDDSEIFYEAAKKLEKKELYLESDLARKYALDRCWKKYIKNVDIIIRRPNEVKGKRYKDDKMDEILRDYMILVEDKCVGKSKKNELKELCNECRGYCESNGISEIEGVRIVLKDYIKENRNKFLKYKALVKEHNFHDSINPVDYFSVLVSEMAFAVALFSLLHTDIVFNVVIICALTVVVVILMFMSIVQKNIQNNNLKWIKYIEVVLDDMEEQFK